MQCEDYDITTADDEMEEETRAKKRKHHPEFVYPEDNSFQGNETFLHVYPFTMLICSILQIMRQQFQLSMTIPHLTVISLHYP